MASSSKTFKKVKSAMEYVEGLEPSGKARYYEKLHLIGGLDPYEMTSELSEDNVLLPAVTYPDIVNYLIFTPSPYTVEDLKFFKGLEAYNQMCCGWVRELKARKFDDKCLVKAKVLHSQRLSDKALEAWIIAEENGTVLAGHCTCMAGLGETCTHVAALLFMVEGVVQIRDSKTVTQEMGNWLLPDTENAAEYKECRDIDFISSKSLKKRLDSDIKCEDKSKHDSRPGTPAVPKVPKPTKAETEAFFKALHECGSKSVVLSLIPPYADEFVPKALAKDN